jgi:hypothetical protein
VACDCDGVLPSLADTAFLLRKSEAETAALIETLKTERSIGRRPGATASSKIRRSRATDAQAQYAQVLAEPFSVRL